MQELSNFDSWFQLMKENSHTPSGLVDTAVFVNDTLSLAKRIYDDLELTIEYHSGHDLLAIAFLFIVNIDTAYDGKLLFR
ncbi:hypothetical protein OLK001_08490 [Synechocystis sp. LKSZ1]